MYPASATYRCPCIAGAREQSFLLATYSGISTLSRVELAGFEPAAC